MGEFNFITATMEEILEHLQSIIAAEGVSEETGKKITQLLIDASVLKLQAVHQLNDFGDDATFQYAHALLDEAARITAYLHETMHG